MVRSSEWTLLHNSHLLREMTSRGSKVQDQVLNQFGIVSNCWKQQLDRGQSLVQLIEQAQAQGFRAVELRTGSLGEFEADVAAASVSSGACLRLAELAKQFPSIDFNLAIDFPFFGGQPPLDGDDVIASIEAAKCLSHDGSPHLRLVDTVTRSRNPDSTAIEAASQALAAMTQRMVQQGGRLSVEHAYQTWGTFQLVMSQARRRLGANADRLRCCFDPCNLLLTEPPDQIPGIVETIRPAEVSMIHIKQRRNGSIQPDIQAGDLDWPVLLKSLTSNKHHGPWLFEIAASDDIWTHLEHSRQFVLASL